MEIQFEPSPVEWIRFLPDPLPPDPQDVSHIDVRSMGRYPSYRYKLEEARRVRKMVGQVLDVYDPLRLINDKRLGYIFADRHGIAHPEVYGDFPTFDRISWDRLPDSFVLKSRFGSSNRGVKALIRKENDTYWDLLRDRAWTIAEMADAQRDLEAAQLASQSMFAEELVLKSSTPAEVADDWKFYCFDGRVGISMQRDLRGSADHADWRFVFRDRHWSQLGPVKFVDRLDPDLALPSDPDSLIEVAERLSRLIGHPFIRIDLFESPRGPLLGEFTPLPGPPEIFTRELDVMLGAFWEQADARLYARLVESGAWRHLAVEEGELSPSVEPGAVPDTDRDRRVTSTNGAPELEATRSALKESRRRIVDQVGRLRELEESLEDATAEMSELSRRLDEDVATIERLRSERDSESAAIQALRDTLLGSQRRVERLVTDREVLRRRLEDRDRKLSALRQRRWWRLGQVLGRIRRNPARILRLPVDLVAVSRRRDRR